MIARIWHGVTKAEQANEYLEYLNKTGIPDYQNTPGNRGAFVLLKVKNEKAYFQTLSFWDSIESIKQFAGEDYEKARYYTKDKEFLLEFELFVEHFEAFGNIIDLSIDNVKTEFR